MDLSLEALRQALAIRQEIEELEQRLSRLFGGEVARSPKRTAARKSATHAELTLAAREGAAHGGASGSKTARAAGKKAGLSSAGRKRLAEAMKARWATRRVVASSLHGDSTTEPPPPVKKKSRA